MRKEVLSLGTNSGRELDIDDSAHAMSDVRVESNEIEAFGKRWGSGSTSSGRPCKSSSVITLDETAFHREVAVVVRGVRVVTMVDALGGVNGGTSLSSEDAKRGEER